MQDDLKQLVDRANPNISSGDAVMVIMGLQDSLNLERRIFVQLLIIHSIFNPAQELATQQEELRKRPQEDWILV